MKFTIFVAITVLIAYCRFQMPPGSPDLLAVWLVTLAFYTESKFGIFQAFWIGILHSFPTADPFVPMICILTYKVLQHQRFHLGRDQFIPRFIVVVGLVTTFNFLEWTRLSPEIRPDINATLQLFGIHAAMTALMGIPILSMGKRMEHYLGFRQTQYDF